MTVKLSTSENIRIPEPFYRYFGLSFIGCNFTVNGFSS